MESHTGRHYIKVDYGKGECTGMKCPICNKYLTSKKDVLIHMDSSHFNQIPANMTAAKYYFALNHGGETTGKCRVCANPTDFDEVTGRTKVLCINPKCKETFAKIAQERNIKKFGVPHLLNDQDHQMKMLAHRKISGEYEWSDGTHKIPYVGSYERRFLEFLDNFLSFDPATIYSPCPFSIYYDFEGETLTHTPDFYIDILNLVVEIKHGGANPNTHPKIQKVDVAKDKAKENAIRNKTDYNYIKITDNDFHPFIKMLFTLTENIQQGQPVRQIMINESVDPELSHATVTGDPLDYWLNGVNNSASTLFGTDKAAPTDLYLHFFGEADGLTVTDVIIGITTSDSFQDMIYFEDESYKYMKAGMLKKIRPKFMCTYKYIGNFDIDKDVEKLQEMAKTKKKLKVLDNVEALVTVFRKTFDDKKRYTLLDIAMDPDFVKYRAVRKNRGMSADNDDSDLLSYVRT